MRASSFFLCFVLVKLGWVGWEQGVSFFFPVLSLFCIL